jgi:hypothetical protein
MVEINAECPAMISFHEPVGPKSIAATDVAQRFGTSKIEIFGKHSILDLSRNAQTIQRNVKLLSANGYFHTN